jgi:hypothetical protein
MSVVDNRHAIRNPFGPEPGDMDVFVKTLKTTRIPDLFRTAAGLQGHAQQLQQQLNRLAKVEGHSGEEVDQAIRASKELRSALIKSKQAAQQSGFICPWLFPYPFSFA